MFLLIILHLFLVPTFARNEPCSVSFSKQAQAKNITQNCKTQTLGAEFAWNYNNISRTLDILLSAKLDAETGWLAWGLNPGPRPAMVGTRALVGIKRKTTLSHGMYNVTASTLFGCGLLPSKIELDVREFGFFRDSGQTDLYMIHARVILPAEFIDGNKANMVWQVGNAVKGEQPSGHSLDLEHIDSREIIDLMSGSLLGFEHEKLQRLRIVHGIMNMLGWGALLPFGAIIARYFRKFPFPCSTWFSLHIACQILGYILGTIGFVIGLLLGGASGYYPRFRVHRILGIIVFTFATLQMLALRLKPSQKDDYRVYWNMYHHLLGYGLIAMIVVNIFQGIAILGATPPWTWTYVGILILLGCSAFILEVVSWVMFLIRTRDGNFTRTRFSPEHPTRNRG